MKKEIKYIVNDNGCFICTSHAKTKFGYPRIKINQKDLRMHRYLYEQSFGVIPDGLVIRHKCDNPSCINLDHLELGTYKDNMRDKVERNRATTSLQTGQHNNNAILTEEIVRQIKSDKNSTNVALGIKYGVHHATISAIRNNKIWSHII